MKWKVSFPTRKGTHGTLLIQFGIRGHNKSPETVTVQEHKTATVGIDVTAPATAGGTGPGPSLEL